MARTLKILSIVAIAGLVSACDSNSNLQNAGIGAAAGYGVAAATGSNLATGAAIGAAAGALTNDAKAAVR